jgi:ubiquitin-protein ligase E3 A
LNSNQAAILAVNLAKDKSQLCKNMNMTSDQEARTSQERASFTRNSENAQLHNQMRNDEENEDDDDVITSSSSSRATSASVSRSTDLKSVDDALKDAIKFVSKINEKSSSANNQEEQKKQPYLSENRIANLIKKCKLSLSHEEKMEVDNEPHASSTTDKHGFSPLINLVQCVFQSYESLALSFRFKTTHEIEMSKTMPCAPPFNIDFNSIRRSYSLLFAIPNESVIEEMEKAIDFSVSTLCVSIRMMLKKNELKESELDQISHALLVVNELPMLEDPKYMDKCAKIFYSAMSELPAKASVKIVRMWSLWSADELKIFLNRLQQFITITVISKQLEEPNLDNDDEEEEEENERICLHKNEGVSGAVGCLRLIFYASILGGRLDPPEQIEKEHKVESGEMAFMQSTQVNEEPSSVLHESTLLFNTKQDPIEELLNLRPIDCREPKISNEQFINEVANKYIDMQHDYVEYIQHMQSLEQRSYQFNKNKKQIFSFLSHPFFLMLSKKMLGLYYDNKIKMMRERRNNIMMSLLEGSIPNPYFKMRLSRSNLLAEALNLMELQEQENPEILRRQLFIEFENEQGIDQGGVSKEFFQLAIDELLNKGYTFFTYDETSHYYWFTPCTIETEKEFRLIGFLFGIAIYNSVLLDVQFPPVFFRKLMGKLGTFEDLHFSHPVRNFYFRYVLKQYGLYLIFFLVS